jgi:hypothetical protein
LSEAKSATELLCDLLDEAGARVTFSKNCRSGFVGDLCGCWRCRKVAPADEDPATAREAALIDRAERTARSLYARFAKEPG